MPVCDIWYNNLAAVLSEFLSARNARSKLGIPKIAIISIYSVLYYGGPPLYELSSIEW